MITKEPYEKILVYRMCFPESELLNVGNTYVVNNYSNDVHIYSNNFYDSIEYILDTEKTIIGCPIYFYKIIVNVTESLSNPYNQRTTTAKLVEELDFSPRIIRNNRNYITYIECSNKKGAWYTYNDKNQMMHYRDSDGTEYEWEYSGDKCVKYLNKNNKMIFNLQ